MSARTDGDFAAVPFEDEARVGDLANRQRPIGVFDSGVGGLTVVSALRRLLPNEDIFYLGDNARIP